MSDIFGQREDITWISIKNINKASLADKDLDPTFQIGRDDDDGKQQSPLIQGYVEEIRLSDHEFENKMSKKLGITFRDSDGKKLVLSMFWGSIARGIVNSLADVPLLHTIQLFVTKVEKNDKVYAQCYVSVNGKKGKKGWEKESWVKPKWHFDFDTQKSMTDVIKDKADQVVKVDYTDLDNALYELIPVINKAITDASDQRDLDEVKDDKEFTGEEGKEKKVVDADAELAHDLGEDQEMSDEDLGSQIDADAEKKSEEFSKEAAAKAHASAKDGTDADDLPF